MITTKLERRAARQSAKRARFAEACSELADLIPYGHLMAQTDPASFMNAAAVEIERLRQVVTFDEQQFDWLVQNRPPELAPGTYKPLKKE